MGNWAWLIPVMVAISAFGGLSVHVMASSRMLFVGARNGHFPAFLSHLNINRLTPVASLTFLVNYLFDIFCNLHLSKRASITELFITFNVIHW